EEHFKGVVVIDAALLLEWGLERGCDAVIAVVASEDEQVARLMRARGVNRDQAMQRLSVQSSNRAFADAADETLENHGTPYELEQAARALLQRLEARHGWRT